MRRALRRAAQVFVAAGALGLVSPALAQSSHPAGKSSPIPASRTVEPAPVEVLTSEAALAVAPTTPWAGQAMTTAAKSGTVVEAPVHNPPNGGKWPTAYEEKPARVAYATTGTVVFDDDLTPPPPLKPVPSPSPAPSAVKPVAAFSLASPTTPLPTPMIVKKPAGDPFAPLPNSAASRLKHDIETVCGKQARDVQVVVQADKLIHVKVKVDDVKAQLALTDKILQLPEMATPNVRLEMHVTDKK